MNNREEYKGYIIDAAPLRLQGTGMWTMNLGIERHTGDAVHRKPFQGQKEKCQDQTEAVRRCLAYGREIINGKISNCSVSHL